MKFNVMLLISLVLCCYQTRETRAIMSTVLKVLKFGTDISSFFKNLFQGTSNQDETKVIIDTISRRIEQSTKTIVLELRLQSHISELRETALTIKTLMQMVENIVTATELDRPHFKDRFRAAFGQERNQVYRIKNLLTFAIPVDGISSTLLDRVAEKTKCSVTVLEEFQDYYMTLVSDAFGLAILYEEIDGGDIINHVTKIWTDYSKELFDKFEKKISQCKAKTTPSVVESNASSPILDMSCVGWICVEMMFVLMRGIL